VKKLVGLVVVLSVLGMGSVSLLQASTESQEKVWLCHSTGRVSDGTVLNGAGNAIPAGRGVGVVILVSENAARQHRANHGDRGFFRPWRAVGVLCTTND